MGGHAFAGEGMRRCRVALLKHPLCKRSPPPGGQRMVTCLLDESLEGLLPLLFDPLANSHLSRPLDSLQVDREPRRGIGVASVAAEPCLVEHHRLGNRRGDVARLRRSIPGKKRVAASQQGPRGIRLKHIFRSHQPPLARRGKGDGVGHHHIPERRPHRHSTGHILGAVAVLPIQPTDADCARIKNRSPLFGGQQFQRLGVTEGPLKPPLDLGDDQWQVPLGNRRQVFRRHATTGALGKPPAICQEVVPGPVGSHGLQHAAGLRSRCHDGRIEAEQPLRVVRRAVAGLSEHPRGDSTSHLGPGPIGNRVFHEAFERRGRRLWPSLAQVLFDLLPGSFSWPRGNVGLTR